MSAPGDALADKSRARLDWFGLGPYDMILSRQEALRSRRLADEIPDHWLAGEHPLVLTRGVRAATDEPLPAAPSPLAAAPVFKIDRGGMTTLHSPGQLIIYPIAKLAAGSIGAGAFARALLETMRAWTLDEFGVAAQIEPGRPGLFVGGRKLLSVGVSARGGVTMHGVAMNLSNDLTLWNGLVACGDPDVRPTSVAALTGRAAAPIECAPSLARWLKDRWAYEIVDAD